MSQKDSYVCLNDMGLYKMDILQCDTEFIGYTSGVTMTDIAMTPSRSLYGIDFYTLYSIDTLTASPTLISTIDSAGYGFNSLVAIDDNTLLGVRVTSGIYKINVSDGSVQLIGNCGYSPAGDITYYKGYFYIVDAASQLIRIKFDKNYNSILSVEPVGVIVTPRNSVYGVLAAGEASCLTDNLKLFAFEENNIYQINPSNASVSLYCDSVYVFSATGATSFVEVNFDTPNDTLEMPNIFTPNNDGVNDIFTFSKTMEVKKLDIQIFDRWGKVVFSDDKNTIEWDGTNKDHLNCNDGIYYYLIKYSNNCSKEFISKGFVQLIR